MSYEAAATLVDLLDRGRTSFSGDYSPRGSNPHVCRPQETSVWPDGAAGLHRTGKGGPRSNCFAQPAGNDRVLPRGLINRHRSSIETRPTKKTSSAFTWRTPEPAF